MQYCLFRLRFRKSQQRTGLNLLLCRTREEHSCSLHSWDVLHAGSLLTATEHSTDRGQSTGFKRGRIQQVEGTACLRTWIYLLASSNQYFALNKLEKDLGCALFPHLYLPVWKETPVYQHLLVFFHHRSQPFICKGERDLASDSDLTLSTLNISLLFRRQA